MYKLGCEADGCGCNKEPIGDFERNAREKAEWENEMPIALCKQHAGKRKAIRCRLLIKDNELKIYIKAK